MKPQIIWSDDLRVSEAFSDKKLKRFMKKLDKGKGRNTFKLLTISYIDGDQLEIINPRDVVKGHYFSDVCKVIGVATDDDDALMMLHDFTTEVYLATGDVKLKEYFETSFYKEEA